MNFQYITIYYWKIYYEKKWLINYYALIKRQISRKLQPASIRINS